MAQEMYKHDALLHLVWTIAVADGAPGAEKNVTPEEDSYLDTVRKQEGIKIDWDDFNAKRKSLNYNRERIIDEACKALRGCGKDWKIKCLGYMQRMAWVSQEDDLENNMSDKEWSLVLRAQKELGLTDDERKNAYQLLPKI
jgi:fructose-specific phosphotransferase system component IIB